MGLDRRLKHAARDAVLIGVVLTLGGCRQKRGAGDQHETPPSRRPAASTPLPVDRALPGELAEGTARAFGLLLPRVMRVSGRFEDVVFATGDAPADQVANYVRQRVNADQIVTGPEKTVFARATIKSTPGPLIAVSVLSRDGRTELEIRNVAPKPAKDGLSPDERWRELGLNPDGTPLDPTRLR